MHDTSIRYLIGITMIPGIGSITARKLIAYSGSAEAVFAEKKKALLNIPDIGEKVAGAMMTADVLQQADAEIEYSEKNKIRIITCYDSDYPERMKQCPDAPLVLYMRGNADLNAPKMIGIVGTRHATDYGMEMTANIVRDLADRGHQPVIVSGLAYGIDITAHRAALRAGVPTIGVVAHGLDMLYPAAHRQTAREMMDNGALLTEFCSNTVADKPLFVRRNRIIAGTTDATIVVESGVTGGALITAEYANSYNRDVFAVPGRTDDIRSQGCNKLIKINKAHLAESAADIEYILNWSSAQKAQGIQQQLFFSLSEDEKKIVDLIRQQHEIYIDEICFNTGIPVHKVSSLLLNLEMNNIVKSLPGRKYKVMA